MYYKVFIIVTRKADTRVGWMSASERRLVVYCKAHRISKSEAVKKALNLLLTDKAYQLTPYELGQAGFGADKTNSGNIARRTKMLLRNMAL